jgi:hypothetical protein
MVKVPSRQNCTTGAGGMIAQCVAEILADHVKLSVEGIDRLYLNVYVPRLQAELGIVGFFRHHRRQPLPSGALMAPISRRFVAALEFRSKTGAEHRPVPKEGAQRRPCSRTATGGEAACAFRHPLGDLAVPGLGIEAMRPRHATCLRLRRCSILTIFETCSPQRSRASRRSARNSCRWYTAATPEIVPLW